ncbi:unnamed protein product [Ilex paraguariensis]|uniref:Uncharacterized protein n=1 Tax=Ilex paraguariensis TaxID=185542 RepID=A0ABC8TB35_9AQUA
MGRLTRHGPYRFIVCCVEASFLHLHACFPQKKAQIVAIHRDSYLWCADDKPFVPTYQVSKERAKSLGINFTSLEDSIKETVDSLKEKNFI